MQLRSEIRSESLIIPAGNVMLNGDLCIPEGSTSLVAFIHGSGSSRFSSRNRYVAGVLNSSGFATLLFDLLTPQEEQIDNVSRMLRFNIELLAGRVINATSWLNNYEKTHGMKLGYFGASTGAAAALVAAAHIPDVIGAVVSRGGRPDLAGASLYHVHAPTLLIVGGDDVEVLRMNKEAGKLLSCIKKLAVVPGATHLFEERGTLEQACELACQWFSQYLQ